MKMKKNQNQYFQYFTKEKYWRKRHILNFVYKYKNYDLIDPFAGNGDLLNSFSNFRKKIGYDIDKSLKWKVNDSLQKIPFHKNGFIITNPPYLSKVSSKRKKINHQAFLSSNRNDLYQIALDKMISSKMPGIAIVPETFINSKYDKKHVYSITILIPNPFQDTETPVCIICFDPNKTFKKTKIYKNNAFLNYYEDIKKIAQKMFKNNQKKKIIFNDNNGNLALIGYDSSNKNRIKFLKINKLKYNKKIKISSRVISKIKINDEIINDQFIKKLNDKLNKYRKITNDVLLSPFKGNCQLNGKTDRRRRLDFRTARNIINSL